MISHGVRNRIRKNALSVLSPEWAEAALLFAHLLLLDLETTNGRIVGFFWIFQTLPKTSLRRFRRNKCRYYSDEVFSGETMEPVARLWPSPRIHVPGPVLPSCESLFPRQTTVFSSAEAATQA